MSTKSPVEEGDRLKVKIIAIGPHNKGVARISDFTIFVLGGVEVGDEITVKITKLARTYAEAKRVE